MGGPLLHYSLLIFFDDGLTCASSNGRLTTDKQMDYLAHFDHRSVGFLGKLPQRTVGYVDCVLRRLSALAKS